MWSISYDLKRLIPPQKVGYEFIKPFKLYIPYKEIGLKVLVRKEQPLPFFYEIILKLIDCKCNEISHISELTGVEQEILNDVVGEMCRLNYAHIKSNTIILTPKGKEALNSLKNTLIEKEEINKIFINAITGKIDDLDFFHSRPDKNCPCLDEIVKINEDFINNNFNSLNDYYQKRQEEWEVKNFTTNTKNEIYEITGIEYEKLCYLEKKAYVYRNIRDNDLVFECENDIDNRYGILYSKQISNSTGARNLLVNKFEAEKYLPNSFIRDDEKEQVTQKLIALIKTANLTNKRDYEEVESSYFTDRYLLDSEYIEILSSIKHIRPTEIIISSGNLSSILNHNIIAGLHINLDRSNVIIISNSNEWGIKSIKDNFLNTKHKRKDRLQWYDRNDIKQTDIILGQQCAIKINYIPISVGKDYLIREVGEIIFDIKEVQQRKEQLLKEHNCI